MRHTSLIIGNADSCCLSLYADTHCRLKLARPCITGRLQQSNSPLAMSPPFERSTQIVGAEETSTSKARTAIRSDTACSWLFSWYIFVTACRLRTSDFAITRTDSCSEAPGHHHHRDACRPFSAHILCVGPPSWCLQHTMLSFATQFLEELGV